MTSPALHNNSNRAVGNMARLPAAAEAPAVNMDDDNLVAYAQAEKDTATDSGFIGNQPSDVAEGPSGNGTATGSDSVTDLSVSNLSISTAKPSPDLQPGTQDTGIIASTNKPDAEPPCTTVASTEPVPTYYPPRRPNIFRARAKHLAFPQQDRNPVATDTVDKPEGALDENGEDFTMDDFDEFQSAQRRQMEKKTKKFMRVVQQYSWRSRVEDLGTVQEIEE